MVYKLDSAFGLPKNRYAAKITAPITMAMKIGRLSFNTRSSVRSQPINNIDNIVAGIPSML